MHTSLHTPLETLLAPFAALLSPLPHPLSGATKGPSCGPNLEYDAHYLELFIKLIPKQKMTVGGEAGSEKLESELEPLRWTEIEQDCLALMQRTRDARLAAVFTRCRVQQGQWQGLLEGLALTLTLLRTFPDCLHPALIPDDAEDGEYDALPRADALSALADHDGLLNDIRSLPLEDGGRLRVHLRDVERALTRPHPDNVLPPDAARRMLTDMRQKTAPHCMALLDALKLVKCIVKEAQESMEKAEQDVDDALRLQPLLDILQTVASAAQGVGQGPRDGQESQQDVGANSALVHHSMEQNPVPASLAELPVPATHTAPAAIVHRNEARERIREARLWFEEHEPSSPVALLLRKAEQIVGKRFAEVVETLPMELLEKWEQEQ